MDSSGEIYKKKRIFENATIKAYTYNLSGENFNYESVNNSSCENIDSDDFVTAVRVEVILQNKPVFSKEYLTKKELAENATIEDLFSDGLNYDYDLLYKENNKDKYIKENPYTEIVNNPKREYYLV